MNMYRIPVELFVYADDAADALAAAAEELNYLARCDNTVAAFDLPLDTAAVIMEEENIDEAAA